MSNWDQEFKCEQERVDVVVEKVNQKLDELQEQMGSVKAEIISLRKNFWEDVTVNIDNIKEMVETAASIRQEAEILSEREHTHRHVQNQYQLLKKLKETPYFGRIDFLEENEREVDQLYLGIGSFYDKETESFLVYDWRAPISSLYYDYSLGPAKYQAPADTISGELLLKRQYMIRSGKIQSMFDTGVTIGDELLQEVLGRNASDQMKSIVSTIQKEQNQIIRNDQSSLLLVQGTAGSGKTSAALQRIAYLMYRYRETIKPEQILLFSPNPMFNSYISNVLPELGEENVQQTTFQDYVEHMVGNEFVVEDSFSQLEYILTSGQNIAYKTRLDGVIYKSSVSFMSLIEKFIKSLGKEGLIFDDIEFRGRILISSDSIYDYFYSLNQSIPLSNRMQLTTEWILQKLKGFEKQERKKDWVEQKIQYLSGDEYNRFLEEQTKDNRISEDMFDDFEHEHDLLTKYIVKKRFDSLRKRVRSLIYVNSMEIFKQLFRWAPQDESVPNNWTDICKQTISRLEDNQLANEDATPYLYLKELLEGFKRNYLVKYVFIDEAQDYSPFQVAFIKHLFPKAKWTILGDINQTIFSHAGNTGLEVISSLFPNEKAEIIRLYRSYRSTRQIVEFTKLMLTDGDLIEPFNRAGNKPLCMKAYSEKEHLEGVIQRVNKLQKDGHKTIAIICKTAKESEKVAKLIDDNLDFYLINKESTVYEQGVLIIPTYLAKGIEFDAVIIFNGSNQVYHKESERKLFYTACTRAMHELSIHTLGDITHFLSTVPEDLFESESLSNMNL
ncbi:RNA polymerase recycling motor HelD [Bacillus thuringiensis]|uniref:RNA polymerase recycling motor HelD n=1 Tax=Bacillus thuringiensis TaxID=1428 RepID=UPI0008CC4C80|nr:RNA polymerase recycling motor HelD [Bacillus thuringiensis]SEJ97155.1 ATP-dependent DNA helicase, Rep family [Bacillus thuringiensis]HDR8476438.1 UvrD-helicase domain-containing protein [Bacillus cereus]